MRRGVPRQVFLAKGQLSSTQSLRVSLWPASSAGGREKLWCAEGMPASLQCWPRNCAYHWGSVLLVRAMAPEEDQRKESVVDSDSPITALYPGTGSEDFDGQLDAPICSL